MKPDKQTYVQNYHAVLNYRPAKGLSNNGRISNKAMFHFIRYNSMWRLDGNEVPEPEYWKSATNESLSPLNYELVTDDVPLDLSIGHDNKRQKFN